MEQKITAVTTYDAQALDALSKLYMRRPKIIRYTYALSCVLFGIGYWLWYGNSSRWISLSFIVLAGYLLMHHRLDKKRLAAQLEMREREKSDEVRTFYCEFTDEHLIKHNNASGETRKISYTVIKNIYELPDFFILETRAGIYYLIDKRTLQNISPAELLAFMKEKNADIKYEHLVKSKRHLRPLLIPAVLFLLFLLFRHFYYAPATTYYYRNSLDSPQGTYALASYYRNKSLYWPESILVLLYNNATGENREIFKDYYCTDAQMIWLNEYTVSINGVMLDVRKDVYEAGKTL